MRSPLLFSAGICFFGLSACGALGGGMEDARLRKSANFQQGYEDGCASATQQGADLRGRLVQDDSLYKADAAYRTGWSNGFSACRTTNTPAGTQPGSNPMGGPLPGTH
ncbi:MAG TPA: hypothetical protein VII49_06775 [Rhizomicrobium sp.]